MLNGADEMTLAAQIQRRPLQDSIRSKVYQRIDPGKLPISAAGHALPRLRARLRIRSILEKGACVRLFRPMIVCAGTWTKEMTRSTARWRGKKVSALQFFLQKVEGGGSLNKAISRKKTNEEKRSGPDDEAAS